MNSGGGARLSTSVAASAASTGRRQKEGSTVTPKQSPYLDGTNNTRMNDPALFESDLLQRILSRKQQQQNEM